MGVAPWFDQAHSLPAEDAVDLDHAKSNSKAEMVIAVPMLSRIANFDDFDPLKLEPSVRLDMIPPGKPLPVDADLVILPGTKATIADLEFLRAQGWDIDLLAYYRRGGRILGICGGYQMLGHLIFDPQAIESSVERCAGLGLLDVETTLGASKEVRSCKATHAASGLPVAGYEIHLGKTQGPDCLRNPFILDGQGEGAMSRDGRIMGTYLHGLFSSDAFRHTYLASLSKKAAFSSDLSYESHVEETLNALADHLEEHLDIEAILKIARSRLL